MGDPPLYHEEQRFRQWWVWLLVLAAVAVPWWTFIEQILLKHPVGDRPLPDWGVWILWAVMGLGLPLFFLQLRLVLEVTAERVSIRYRPLATRVISLSDMESVQARTYDAIREYGGWGVKGWSRRNIAYNVSGNRGVEITLSDGRRVLLGSQRPEELALVIGAHLPVKSPRRRPEGRE